MKRLLITGSPRSGTTAITELLCHDENTFVTNEMQTYLFNPDSHRQRADWNRRISKLDTDNIVSYNWLQKKGATLDDIDNLEPGEKMLEFQHSLGYEIVGDKLPAYVNKLDIVHKRYTNLFYVFTVRDPRAVIASSIRHYKRTVQEERSLARWHFDNIGGAQDMWIESNTNLLVNLKKIHHSRYVLLKYEDCVHHPEKCLLKISNLLNVEINVPNPRGSYFPVHLETWREEIPEVNEHLSDDCLKLMEEFGYSGV